MIRTLILAAALLAVALPAAAQDTCPGCPDSKAKAETKTEQKTETAGVWASKIADLQAKAAEGDARAVAALGAICDGCGTKCDKTMAAKVAKLETAANGGDAAARNKLEKMKWDMVFAAVRVGPLTEQVVFYSAACDQGCPISKNALAILMKETGAKDRADLTAQLTELETKAAKGSGECHTKIASMRAKLAPERAPAKIALSVRVEKLAVAAKGGDEAAQQCLARIAASLESKPEEVVASLKAFETKASNGCQDCVAKLAKVEALIAPATAAKGADCSDCGSGCDGCDDCEDGAGECTKSCPVESRPVKQ